jgi:hypothetical protein
MTSPTIDYSAIEAKLACLALTDDSAELKALLERLKDPSIDALLERLKDPSIDPGERYALKALKFHVLYGSTVPGPFSPIATDSQSQQP